MHFTTHIRSHFLEAKMSYRRRRRRRCTYTQIKKILESRNNQ